MAQSIKNLHAAAGYLVEDTWIAAINAGNYNVIQHMARTLSPSSKMPLPKIG